jgi:hypothetical protein
MALPVKEIEEFFAAGFEPMSPGPGQELHHYDGYAHWSVVYDDKNSLFITADKEVGGNAFPIVELAAFCSRISRSQAGGVGPVLILHPNDTEETRRYVVLTKTKFGRISLSTSVGAEPNRPRAEPGASPNGGPTTLFENSESGRGRHRGAKR